MLFRSLNVTAIAFTLGVWPALAASSEAGSADWPRFRGPNGSGVSRDSSVPSNLGPEENLLWRVETPPGNSSPIVQGARLFITGEQGDERIVIGLDVESGRQLWKKTFRSLREQPAHKRVGRASPTPAADGDGIYVFFTDIGLLALDFGGEVRWRAPLGPFRGVYGVSTSPVVTAGAVVLAADQTEGSFIAAFSKKNGEMLWRRDRPNGSGGYATPILIAGEAERILVSGSREIAIYDAQTGERHWHLDGLPASSFNSPVTGTGVVYVSMASAPGRLSFSVLDKNGDGRIEGSELDAGPPGWFGLGRFPRETAMGF